MRDNEVDLKNWYLNMENGVTWKIRNRRKIYK